MFLSILSPSLGDMRAEPSLACHIPASCPRRPSREKIRASALPPCLAPKHPGSRIRSQHLSVDYVPAAESWEMMRPRPAWLRRRCDPEEPTGRDGCTYLPAKVTRFLWSDLPSLLLQTPAHLMKPCDTGCG